MIGNYKIITVTHKSSTIKDIGKFVLPESNGVPLSIRLEKAREQLSISDLLYLPTCNRVMYFFQTEREFEQGFLEEFTRFFYPEWKVGKAIGKFMFYEGEEAIRHLFEVASSVDSLVVGEREIIRQLRESYRKCQEMGIIGDSVRLAMDATVRTAKSVYATTGIGQKPVSIVSLAIKKLLEAGISPTDRVLIVGAGQTNLLVCKFLKKYGFTNVVVFNRSLTKAEEVAAVVAGNALPLSNLAEYDKGFDGMVVCTASTEAIITHELYKQLLKGEKDKKVVVDLAIPNNVAKEVVESFEIDYIEIEGLKKLAEKNLQFRSNEVEKAKLLIEESIIEFKSLYAERLLERAFGDMPKRIKAVKSKAINEVFRKEIDGLDDETRALMERMMDYMEKKCIGIPMKVAKETILP